MLNLLLKKIILFSLLLICFLMPYTNSYAADDFSPSTKAAYDLSIGGTQEFIISDTDGNEVYITISELPTNQRVANGTYKVTYTAPLCWKAGYNITISNNCITSVNNKFHNTYTSVIISDRLAKEGTKQASYYLGYQMGGMFSSTGMRSIISDNKLNVFGI